MITLHNGTKLSLKSRHQNYKLFKHKLTIGEVIKDPSEHPHKMKVKIYGDMYDEGGGYVRELLRVTDTIWLERIGIAGYLPHVHEIIGELDEEEFARMCAELGGA